MKNDKKMILKVLVGSRAHGLHEENSDHDYRGVYVLPTTKILSLGYRYKGSDWFEGKEDQTTYEIGHFLHLATKCNPSILEVFKGPIYLIDKDSGVSTNMLGVELRELFPYVWNPTDAFNAFTGYSFNQRKKMLDEKDDRAEKYAVAYLRTLWNLRDLLKTKDFKLEITDRQFKEDLRAVRNGEWSFGKVLDCAEGLIEICRKELEKCKQESNIEKVNQFLFKVRKEYWDDSNF